MPDVTGKIRERWVATGQADGPLGRPIADEEDAGQGMRRQRFEHGEIGWSPAQQMVVNAYRLWNVVYFEWQLEPDTFNYRYFQYEVFLDNVAQGHGNGTRELPARTQGRVRLRLRGYGEYAFTVRGCDDRDADTCRQGWSVHVRVNVGPHPGAAPAGGPPVVGLIAERWHELGAWDGPLGLPLAAEAVLDGGRRLQEFTHGSISVDPRFGPGMTLTAYQHGPAIVVNWGRALHESGLAYTVFMVKLYVVEADVATYHVDDPETAGWVQAGCGEIRVEPPKGAGRYKVELWPALASAGGAFTGAVWPFGWVSYDPGPDSFPVEPYAAGGSPAAAIVSDPYRVAAVARRLAQVQPVYPGVQLRHGEDLCSGLVARLHAARTDPGFAGPGELPNLVLVNEALLDLVPGPVGTDTHEDQTFVVFTCARQVGEYDTMLKHLVIIAHRYWYLLQPRTYRYLVDTLLWVRGPHDPGVETKEFCCDWIDSSLLTAPLHIPLGGHPLICVDVPESENHLLLIESSRYLTNQLLLTGTGDPRYDNDRNGLTEWLLRYLQVIARHDFLEFNARPYQRYSLNALLNLAEFAHGPVRTAATILLDYTTTKFAVSSVGLRRLGPFRRLKENLNSTAEAEHNELLVSGRADPQTGFFHAYAGPTTGRYPDLWLQESAIAGFSSYRPPYAAYVLALTGWTGQHRFYHGQRPAVVGSVEPEDRAAGGIEIYYRSPSFLLSAGGMFLNSGYGHDEVMGYAQVAIAQATTLLPTKGQLTFADLPRFERWTDRDANNTAVHNGFATGANLRIPNRWANPTAPPAFPGSALDWGRSDAGAVGWHFLDLDSEANGRLGLYVAAYRAAMSEAILAALPPAALGTLPENLGVLYAVEATSVISFEAFRRTVLDANPLGELNLGQEHVFTTITGSRITFRIVPVSYPYLNRFIRVDDEILPPDLKVLPLAEGGYLRSSGHDGSFTISYPGCDSPLTLDFRDPLRPVRTEEQPCADRYQAMADAYFQLSWQLWHAGRLRDGLAAARDRVATYRRAVALDPARFPPLLAQALADEAAFRAADVPGAVAAGTSAAGMFEQLAGIPVAEPAAPALVASYPELGLLATNGHWKGLAGALFNLGWAHWDTANLATDPAEGSRHQAAALTLMRNRVRVYERLSAPDQPAEEQVVNRIVLAHALVDEAAFRAADVPGAIVAATRAVALFEPLAGLDLAPPEPPALVHRYPDLGTTPVNAHWDGLAGALSTLAWAYWDSATGVDPAEGAVRQAAALTAMRNRVTLFERLTGSAYDRYAPLWAQALTDEAAFRTADLPGAVVAGRHSVALFEHLAHIQVGPAQPPASAAGYPDLTGLTPNEHWAGLTGALFALAWAYWDSAGTGEDPAVARRDARATMHNRVLVFERLTAPDRPAAEIATYQPKLVRAKLDEAAFAPPG